MPTPNSLEEKGIFVDIGDCRVHSVGDNIHFFTPVPISDSRRCHLHHIPELHYVLSGSLDEIIHDRQRLTVPAEHILFIPANVLHENPDQEGMRLIFNFALEPLPQKTSRAFSEYEYYSSLFGRVQEPIVLKNSVLAYCLSQLAGLAETPQNAHRREPLLAFFFIQFCQEISAACKTDALPGPAPVSSRHNQQYYLIEHYINTHYHEKTSAEDIAAVLHISRRQADRVVGQLFGKSYAAAITDQRMSVAEMLLKKTSLSCSQVAEKVGYNSYPGFFLAFKQYFGIAPEEVRM